MKTSEIIFAVIAVYGAVLSTINLVRQHLSDRVKLKLTILRDMVLTDSGDFVTVFTVTNAGRRPVTIRTCGARGLHPHPSCVAGISAPRLPCEITENQFVNWTFDPDELDIATVDYWFAVDSLDVEHRLREATRWEHWNSDRRWKKEARKRRKQIASAMTTKN